MDYRAALIQFYQRYNPAKLPEVDALLRKYKGREEELLHALRVKYKVQEQPKAEPKATVAPPPRQEPPPQMEPVQTEPIRTEPPKKEEPKAQTASEEDSAYATPKASDYKGQTAAERAEYWKKKLRDRDKERNEEKEAQQERAAEKMKVIKGGKRVEKESEEEEEVDEERKPWFKKVILIGAGIAVVLLLAAAFLLLRNNISDEKLKEAIEHENKKEGLEPGVLKNEDSLSSKKDNEDFSLNEEDDRDNSNNSNKAPTVDDVINKEKTEPAKKVPPKQEEEINVPAEKKEVPVEVGLKKGRFYIGIAAVSNEGTAQAQAQDLRRQGFENAGYYYIPDYDPKGKNFYKIYVGPYPSIQDAEDALVNVKAVSPNAYCYQLK